jgi:release factor glutamine methyltransferase
MTISAALAQAKRKLIAKQISSAQLDAEILLSSIIKKPREWLLAHDEKPLKAAEQKKYSTLVARRAKYEPVAYLLGQKDFYGLTLKVSPAVLIPRPETEQLIDEVLKIARQQTAIGQKPAILDIGTGSGAIALAFKKALPKARILALEISPRALSLARLNAKNSRLKIDIIKSDLLAKAPVKLLGGSILTVNLPYVDKTETRKFPKEIKTGLKYEPSGAIFAGQQGTAVYEKLFRQIAKLPAGNQPSFMIAEIGSYHAKKFLALANKYFVQAKISLKKDLFGRNRFLIIKF